jgi:site-specific DNA recombinase
LKGLIRCVPCGAAMTPIHTTRQKTKRYRYYVCSSAQKKGWHTCPSKSVPAGQIEHFVVEQIKAIGRDEALLREVLTEARRQDEARAAELEAEQRALERDLTAWHTEIRRMTLQMKPGEDNGPLISRLADLQERIGRVETRVRKVRVGPHNRERGYFRFTVTPISVPFSLSIPFRTPIRRSHSFPIISFSSRRAVS